MQHVTNTPKKNVIAPNNTMRGKKNLIKQFAMTK